MAGITGERLIGDRGPNTAQPLSFFDDFTAMTDEQASRLEPRSVPTTWTAGSTPSTPG